jgi:hypothetical protein
MLGSEYSINGEKHLFRGESITYEEVVALSCYSPSSIIYKGEHSGILKPNEQVEVTDGMTFSVARTG